MYPFGAIQKDGKKGFELVAISVTVTVPSCDTAPKCTGTFSEDVVQPKCSITFLVARGKLDILFKAKKSRDEIFKS